VGRRIKIPPRRQCFNVSCNGIMKHRVQKILTISAVILFILAFLLDVSAFGQYWNSFWESIDVRNIAAIIGIVIAFGLFLGLFFFRKKTYKQRLSWTLPIAFILFSLADITKATIGYYGLNEEYNYFSAKRDIKREKIQILEMGLIMPDPNISWEKQQAVQRIVEQRFGYKSVYLGCIVTNGSIIYNNVMEAYLDKINGKGWRIKEGQMRDSILKVDTK
jgi:hypothetical protein